MKHAGHIKSSLSPGCARQRVREKGFLCNCPLSHGRKLLAPPPLPPPSLLSMLFGNALALAVSSLSLLATAAPVADEPRIDYDAVIVGGGPAGLAALSGLARVRRRALLIDSGEYRNGPTRHMHDVLGYDGEHTSQRIPQLGTPAAKDMLSLTT